MSSQHGCEDKNKGQTGQNFADPRIFRSDRRWPLSSAPPHLLYKLRGQFSSPLL
jgi:hypothetical protein